MSAFDIYTTPLRNWPYSSQFFDHLTFGKALLLDMPDILAEGSLIHYVLTDDEPLDYDDACYIGNEES